MPQVMTGVDVGHDTIRIAQLKAKGDRFELTGLTAVPLEELGRLPDNEKKRELVNAKVKKAAAAAGIKPSNFVLGASGRSTMIRYVQMPPSPPWKIKMLMDFELKEQMSKTEPAAFDYKVINPPESSTQFTIMAGLAQNRHLSTLIDLSQHLGQKYPDIDFAALSLFSTFRFGGDYDTNETVMLVDIGATQINVVIQKNGFLFFARNFTDSGGRKITDAIAKELKIPFAEAERLKCERARLYFEAHETPSERDTTLNRILLSQLGQMSAMIESSLMYARAQLKLKKLDLDRILLSGGCANIQGIEQYFETRLKKPTEVFSFGVGLDESRLKQDAAACFSEGAPSFATAIGLALSRLGGGAFTFSLLPDEVKEKKNFLTHELFLWYAAVIFAAIMVLSTISSYMTLGKLRAEVTTRTKAIEGAAAAEKKLRKTTLMTYTQKNAEVNALKARALSGETLMHCLILLNQSVPQKIQRDIVLQSLTSQQPAKKALAAGEVEKTLQEMGLIYLRGYIEARSLKDASSKLLSYTEELKKVTRSGMKRPFFSNVTPETLEAEGKGDDEKDKTARNTKKRFEFRLTLKIGEFE